LLIFQAEEYRSFRPRLANNRLQLATNLSLVTFAVRWLAPGRATRRSSLHFLPVSDLSSISVPTAAEAALVERLRARDESAMTEFYDRYSAALYGVVQRIVPDEDDAADVLQEALVKIWHSMAGYDASRGRLFTWVVNISRNLAIDKIRSRQHRVGTRTDSLDDSLTAQRQAAPDSFRPDHVGLREITEKLIPEQRQVIDLLYFGGFTQSEAAEELNLPLGTVKTRARTALKVLAKLIR